MNKEEKVLEKLLDQTARKQIEWFSFSAFDLDQSFPYYDFQHLVKEESYLHGLETTKNGGYFYLVTLKGITNKGPITELIFGFKQSFGESTTLSKNQQKLHELKALIEYEEPFKEKGLSEILDDFLNDEN